MFQLNFNKQEKNIKMKILDFGIQGSKAMQAKIKLKEGSGIPEGLGLLLELLDFKQDKVRKFNKNKNLCLQTQRN